MTGHTNQNSTPFDFPLVTTSKMIFPLFSVLQHVAPPTGGSPTADTDLMQKISLALFTGILGYLIKHYLTGKLERADARDEADIKAMKAELLELKSAQRKTEMDVFQIKTEMKSGIERLEEKVQDLTKDVGEISQNIGTIQQNMATIKAYLEQLMKPKRST